MECLVVDDNPLAREIIRHLLAQFEWITILAECSSIDEAAPFFQDNTVDLVFLDIEMPKTSGIDFLKRLKEKPITIIVSAYDKYAIQGYDLNVADYLIKPVQLERLREALEKVQNQAIIKSRDASTDIRDYIFIKSDGGLQRLRYEDILWLEAKGDYVKIHCAEKSFLIYNTLKSIEVRLRHRRFQRVHRSYLVPLDKIERIEEGLIYINKKVIPISENYWYRLKASMNIL